MDEGEKEATKHRLRVTTTSVNFVRFKCRNCDSGVSVGRDRLKALLTGNIKKEDCVFDFVVWEDCTPLYPRSE